MLVGLPSACMGSPEKFAAESTLTTRSRQRGHLSTCCAQVSHIMCWQGRRHASSFRVSKQTQHVSSATES